jgi:hypothetical protein
LYAIEREMKDRPPDELLTALQTRSKLVMKQIRVPIADESDRVVSVRGTALFPTARRALLYA